MNHAHTPEAIAERLEKGPHRSYLRDWVYGGIDGAVTTLAVVAGVAGAELSVQTILILGAANLIGDGFSMAAGNYLATKTEHDEHRFYSAAEYEAIRRTPEGEREEVRQILNRKGFEGELLERAVEMQTSNPKRWVQLMLAEEYGLPAQARSPLRASIMTLSAFILCGSVPLLPFVFGFSHDFTLALGLTGVVFFAIGSIKSRWSVTRWWRSGLSTFAVGAAASLLAYFVGGLVKQLTGQ